MTADTSSEEHVKLERRGRVLEITLNRGKVNAIDHATSKALGERSGPCTKILSFGSES